MNFGWTGLFNIQMGVGSGGQLICQGSVPNSATCTHGALGIYRRLWNWAENVGQGLWGWEAVSPPHTAPPFHLWVQCHRLRHGVVATSWHSLSPCSLSCCPGGSPSPSDQTVQRKEQAGSLRLLLYMPPNVRNITSFLGTSTGGGFLMILFWFIGNSEYANLKTRVF